jgi:hypothetical protein
MHRDRPEKFNKVDRSEARPKAGEPRPDRSQEFFLASYRAAYKTLAALDPAAVLKLPNPDGNPTQADMDALRDAILHLHAKMKAVPPTDLTTGG